MKISCSKNDLLYGINIALRAVPGKTTLPILESFLIDATSDIRIIANDNDMGIETVINGKIETPGKITINARILSDIVRKLPDNQVVIETSVNFKVRITCEDSEFVLNGNNPNEFPELPRENTENKITMSQFLLKELIRQTIFSIAATDANAIMRGELFEVSGDQIKIVSLDSHRISIRKEQLANTYEPCKVIVPGKTLNEISRILGGEKDDPVDITFDKKFIIFDIRDGEINIEISSSLGSMNSHLYIHKDGKDLVIGFNPRFFLEALKVIDDEEVDIFFVNSNAPCFIRDKDGGYIYIILPVNINR